MKKLFFVGIIILGISMYASTFANSDTSERSVDEPKDNGIKSQARNDLGDTKRGLVISNRTDNVLYFDVSRCRLPCQFVGGIVKYIDESGNTEWWQHLSGGDKGFTGKKIRINGGETLEMGSTSAVPDGTYATKPCDGGGGISYGLNVYDDLNNRESTENFRHYFGTWWESLCTAHPRYDYTWLNLHRPWTGKGCNLKCETVRLKGTNFFVHADGNTIIMRYE
jgi:hypothetical protein